MSTPVKTLVEKEFNRLQSELKRKESLLKRAKTRQESEATLDGRPRTWTKPSVPGRIMGVSSPGYDPLLDVLIREHPEKDPVNIKKEEKEGDM
jgi:hypothetical protein